MPKLKTLSVAFFLFFTQLSTAQALEPPKIQLANLYNKNINLNDYFVSEKFDGVRGYWDGEKFISRQGNIIHAPQYFTKDLPHETLDGELWIARGKFELVSGIIRQQIPDEAAWQQVHYMVFDMPKNPEIFSKRLEKMQQISATTKSKYLHIIEQKKFSDENSLMAYLQEVVKKGGEGLVLHKADSLYKAARNDDLVKLKTYEDTEAVVIKHIAGKGKYKGMLGALVVRNKDGITFKIGGGFTDEQRKNPPKIGSTITYKYQGKTKNNVPRFARFMRIRDDY